MRALVRGIAPVLRRYVDERVDQCIVSAVLAKGLQSYGGIWSDAADYPANALEVGLDTPRSSKRDTRPVTPVRSTDHRRPPSAPPRVQRLPRSGFVL
jgi:hypothetical protein